MNGYAERAKPPRNAADWPFCDAIRHGEGEKDWPRRLGSRAARAGDIEKKGEWVVSRILYPVPRGGAMIISLGGQSPGPSCDLPGNVGRAVLKCFPI